MRRNDTSLIQGKCSVFELDKGVLCNSETESCTTKQHTRPVRENGLSLKSALQMTKVSFKRQLGKILSMILAVSVASSCLVLNFGNRRGAAGASHYP